MSSVMEPDGSGSGEGQPFHGGNGNGPLYPRPSQPPQCVPSNSVNTPERIREARAIMCRIFGIPEGSDRVLDDVVDAALRMIPRRR